MYKATRALIEERSKFAETSLAVVNVRRLGLDQQQDCFNNAVSNEYRDTLRSGCQQNEIISGWIVYPFDKVHGLTEIVQHWWNYDPVAQVHFDTTSFDEIAGKAVVEYVMDLDVKNIGMRWLDRIASNVGRDIVLLANGQWACAEIAEDSNDRLIPLANLSIENVLLFK